MCINRKVMQYSEKARQKLDKMQRVYIVGCWAHWGVMDFPFSGKYTTRCGEKEPLVWVYNDCNGTEDRYVLVPIHFTTSGRILTWSFDKDAAEKLADEMEAKDRAMMEIYRQELKNAGI